MNSSGLPGVVVNRVSSADAPFDEFDYKPLPPLAPVSVLMGVCSLSGLLSPLGLLFALAGTFLGWVALRQIRVADGTMSGRGLALSGTTLSALLLVGGATLHVYWYQTELPEGHERVNFSLDIAKKDFVIENNQPRIHPDVAKFEGKKLFLKGFMYPEGQVEGLRSFILCKDNGQCCFGGQPKLTDMIKVKLQPGMSARYTDGMVSVAGEFRLRDLRQAGSLEPAYELEATLFTPSKTSY